MRDREALPKRRPSILADATFSVPGQPGEWSYRVGASFYEDGRPAEVFIDAEATIGSQQAALARDAAVVISLALQHGTPLQTLRDAVGREHDGISPASPIGRCLDAVAEMMAAPAPAPETPAEPHPMVPAESRPAPAIKRMSGEPCSTCGNHTLIRNGSCMVCQTCGTTTGCS